MKPEDADEVHAMLAEWHDDTGAGPPTMIAVEEPVLKAMASAPIEAAHGMGAPVATYPIFEQALRRELGHTLEEHQDYVARICEEVSRLAITRPLAACTSNSFFCAFPKLFPTNPSLSHQMTEMAALPENAGHAWFPEVQSAESIKTPSDDNRYIGFPCELLLIFYRFSTDFLLTFDCVSADFCPFWLADLFCATFRPHFDHFRPPVVHYLSLLCHCFTSLLVICGHSSVTVSSACGLTQGLYFAPDSPFSPFLLTDTKKMNSMLFVDQVRILH